MFVDGENSIQNRLVEKFGQMTSREKAVPEVRGAIVDNIYVVATQGNEGVVEEVVQVEIHQIDEEPVVEMNEEVKKVKEVREGRKGSDVAQIAADEHASPEDIADSGGG